VRLGAFVASNTAISFLAWQILNESELSLERSFHRTKSVSINPNNRPPRTEIIKIDETRLVQQSERATKEANQPTACEGKNRNSAPVQQNVCVKCQGRNATQSNKVQRNKIQSHIDRVHLCPITCVCLCVCVRARVHRDACLCPVSGRAPSSTETGCVPLRDAIPPPKNKLLAQFQWSALVPLPCSIAPCFCAVCFVLHNDGPSRKTPVLLLFGGSGFAVVLFEPNRSVPYQTKPHRNAGLPFLRSVRVSMAQFFYGTNCIAVLFAVSLWLCLFRQCR